MCNLFSGLGRANPRIRDAAAMLGLAFVARSLYPCISPAKEHNKAKPRWMVRSHLPDRALDLCKVKNKCWILSTTFLNYKFS